MVVGGGLLRENLDVFEPGDGGGSHPTSRQDCKSLGGDSQASSAAHSLSPFSKSFSFCSTAIPKGFSSEVLFKAVCVALGCFLQVIFIFPRQTVWIAYGVSGSHPLVP